MSNVYDYEPIKVTIYDWLHKALNGNISDSDSAAIPIIRAEDDEVRPKSLYIDYKLLTGAIKVGGIDELVFDSDADSFKTKGQRAITVSVQAYRDGAQGAMQAIQNSLDLPTICDLLRAGGLSVRNNISLTDATVYLETEHEERAILDVIFGLKIDTLDSELSRIEKVSFTSNLPGGKTNLVE